MNATESRGEKKEGVTTADDKAARGGWIMEGTEVAQKRVYRGKYFIRAKEMVGVDVSWMEEEEEEEEHEEKNPRHPFLFDQTTPL